jgi:tRNA (guanine-N7-)-methyltransferase
MPGEANLRTFKREAWRAPPLEVEGLRELLESEKPLDLEIGCGVGLHPLRYASMEPARALIAIEKTREKFSKFARRLERHPEALFQPGGPGVVAVNADAIAWVATHVPERRLDRVFILYPNPSFRNPAARWIRMPFFGFLLSRVKSGGVITFRTNESRYAEEVRLYAEKEWGGERGELRVEATSFSRDSKGIGEPWTHFEAKYLERGERCHQIRILKV